MLKKTFLPARKSFATAIVSCILFIGFTCCLFYSCKKNDFDKPTAAKDNMLAERFFTIPPGTHYMVIKLAEELKRQHALTGFIPAFARIQGMAVWDKAIVSYGPGVYQRSGDGNPGDTIIIVPLVLENDNKVNAYVKAYINDSIILLKLGQSSDYSKYSFSEMVHADSMNANKFALLMMALTKQVFGTSRFKITDNRLFTSITKPANAPDVYKAIRITDSTDISGRFDIICSQTGLFHCIKLPPCTPMSCDGCPFCITWYDYTCGTVDTDPVPSPGPGGGGSGGGGDPGECRVGPPVIDIGIPPCPGPGNGGGWLPIADDTDPYPDGYNPYIADSVIIDTSILNNYPCFDNIIDTLSNSGNLNKKAQILLSTVFGVNKRVHTTIKLDTSLIGTHTNAYTKRTGAVPAGNDLDSLDFSATIFINPELLTNGAKEYIAGTLVHEALHAYIMYIFTLYYQGYISPEDSNIVKSKFPIFWGGLNINSPINEQQQHQLIAENWINVIYTSLYGFTNNAMSSSLKDSVYRAISWEGLETTGIFQLQPNNCTIRAINIAAGNKNNPIPYGIVNHPECSTNYIYTQNNLKLKSLCQ